jgi:hypothetical protein
MDSKLPRASATACYSNGMHRFFARSGSPSREPGHHAHRFAQSTYEAAMIQGWDSVPE